MPRNTRSEKERFDAMIAFTRQGFASFTRSLVEIVIMAGIAGGLTQTIQDDFGRVLAGAGWAAIAVLFLSLALAAVILLAWLGTRNERAEEGDDWPGVRTGPRTITMLPESWTRASYQEYMAAVLDDEDGTGFNQRDAARFGHDRDAFNALVGWCADRGWYRYANGTDNRNGGEWVVSSQTILATTPNDANT